MTIAARFCIARGDFLLSVEFEAPNRGVSAVFGPSGCGKTTLLRAMAGLDRSAQGYLRVGEDIWQDETQFMPPHRRPLGYVFQEASLLPHLSVRRNLEYGLKRVPQEQRRVAFDEAVALLGVMPLLQRSPTDLSGGERQRVAIARTLLTSPRLVLMDEPLASLDHKSKSEILPFLQRLHEELDVPVLYVSHSPEEVARLADYLVLLDGGRVRAVGPVADMLTRLDLPLSQGDTAEAIIEAQVASHDEAFQLTYLDFPGGRFTVARNDLPSGRTVRLRVLAKDVSLTLERQSDTSILNIFPARVEALVPEGPAQVTVRLQSKGVPLLCRLTRKSAAALGLERGKRVHAQVKSVALLV